MKIPVMIQMQNGENGAAALCMMLGYFGRFVPIEEIRDVCVSSRNGSSPAAIARAAEHYGLEASIENMTADQLEKQQLPIMIQWKRRYYTLIKSIRGDIVTVVDPARGVYKLKLNKLEKLFTGTAVIFRKTDEFRTGGRHETLFSLLRGRIKVLFKPMIAVTAFTVFCVVLNLQMAGIQKNVLNDYMGTFYMGTFDFTEKYGGYSLLILYVILMILYIIFSFFKIYLVNRISRNTSAVSGSELFKKILRQPMRFFEQYSIWELISRISSNMTLDRSILQTLVPRIIDAVMSVVYFVTLFGENAVIAVTCAALTAVGIAANMWIQERRAIAARSMTTNGSIVNASLLNGMNMIDTIQSTGGERTFYNMWRASQSRFGKNNMTNYWFSGLSAFAAVLTRNALQAAQLFMGAFFAVHGNFTLGSMALFQGIIGNLSNSVNNCVSAVGTLQTMRTNIERVDDINRRKARPNIPLSENDKEIADKLRGHLSAKNICYRYNQGDPLALDNVSIEVKPGQMVAIVGSTGCGKSTLLKILADLYEAESGEILYDGKRRSEIPDVIFHSSVSSVDQECVMFEDSIYDNIKMWDSTIENYEITLAARDAHIHDRIVREKKKYSTVIEENGRNFSGGELQRLELARALAHEPALLLLDEFTSALDALTEDNVMRSIREKGTACVIVAHRLSTVVDCDRIFVMDKGRIVQEGTHEQLYSQKGLYRTLIG